MINNKFNKKFVRLDNQPFVLILFSSILFLLILLRLFFLQALNYQKYKNMSDQNRIRLIASEPIRGRILDTNGEVLANSKLNYSLILKPQILNNQMWEEYKSKLAELLNVNLEDLDKNYNRNINNQNFSITLVEALNIEQVIRFKEKETNFKGIEIAEKVVRNYPYKTLAAHALGYTSPINKSEFKILSKKGYRLNDLIGRTGVEYAYEEYLRGDWGGEMIEVDATGVYQKSLGVRPSKKGSDIKLTIDLNLQLVAEEVLSDKKGGAVIAMDPRDGAIRAIASKPTFDLNFFSREFKPQKEYNALFFSSEKPLFNRALNAYDPGSVWKVVTALAGLETGKFPSDTILETKPCITYGSQCFREHNDLGFGAIGYDDALRVSSNTFFYQVGYGVGVDEIYKISKILGFAQFSGIELSEQENKGLIANSIWAESGRGWGEPGTTPWLPEDIASMSIGQFVVQVTPIQLAKAYAAIANGGYLVKPHLSRLHIMDDHDMKRKRIDIDPDNLLIIQNGLKKVVQSGTGVSMNFGTVSLPPVSGKTGTAEDGTGGADHAWFVCYTPSENSELVVVAFAENTPGGGSVHALPMARKILETWYSNN